MAHSSGPIEAGLFPARSTAISGNLYAVVSTLLWAIGFPAAEQLLGIMDPLTLITLRFAVACSLMLPIWWVVDGKAMLHAPWGWGMMMGGLTFGVATFLMLLVQDMTDAITVAVFSAAMPLVASLVEFAYGRRRFTSKLLVGIFVAFAGGVICIGDNLTIQFGLGALLVLFSGGLFVLGSHLAVHAMPDVSPIGRATLPFVGGFFVMTLVLLVAHPLGLTRMPERMLSADEFTMLIIYAVGAMALSQMFFIASVGKIGVTMTSFHINTAPLYVMLIMVALGAAWSWPQAIGGAIVVCGAIYVQSRR